MSVKDYFDQTFAEQQEITAADAQRAEFIRDHIPQGIRTILEVGAGSGTVTGRLAEDYEVSALELSTAGTDKLRALGLRCIQGSIDDLPFEDRSFDLVLASQVLEHLDQQLLSAGISEMARVADARIIVTVPNADNLVLLRQECPHCRSVVVPWGHLQRFTSATLERLFDPYGFAATGTTAFGPPVADQTTLWGRLLYTHRRVCNPLRPGRSPPPSIRFPGCHRSRRERCVW